MKKTKQSKADLIRQLARENGGFHSNNYFKEKLKRRYGIDVATSHIQGVLGRFGYERIINLEKQKRIKRAAENLAKVCDYDGALMCQVAHVEARQ